MTEEKKDTTATDAGQASAEKKDAGNKAASTKPAAAKKTNTAKTTTAKKVKALKIVSSQEGFRRAGHSFGREAVTIPVSKLSKKQIDMLMDEPLLAVSETSVDAE